MKKALFIVLIVSALLLLAFGCSVEENVFELSGNTGAIGSFSAVTPTNGSVYESIPVFSWTEAANADYYILEITHEEFSLKDEYYIKKTGLLSTSFVLGADLKKNLTYRWRVTAVNDKNSAYIDGESLSFTYKAISNEYIPVSVGYADEWKLHEEGSVAKVSLDKTNFFGNGSDAIRVIFDKEDTQRGEAHKKSNGWIVLTRSLESEFFGVDGFYFNFYYAGNDADAYFRVIDEDNEYWVARIKLASNTKQEIYVSFDDDFTLRRKGTPVVNETFDTTYLKSMELVFEHVDGDGVAYFGNLSAIKMENYTDRFVSEFDFNEYKSTFTKEGEYFNVASEVSEDGKELTCAFTVSEKAATMKNDDKGYGFFTATVDKLLSAGDAFYFELNCDGVYGKDYNLLFRVIEEDKDIWTFKLPAKEIPEDGKLLIPYSAFYLAEGGFKGDGKKQFYRIKKFQFGLSNYYQTGTFTVANLKVESLIDRVGKDNLYTLEVGSKGEIENFDSYVSGLDVYYKWELSTVNKDEKITLESDTSLGANNKVAKMGYKTDLSEATYHADIVFDAATKKDYTAIKVALKDASNGTTDAIVNLYLHGDGNETYYYSFVDTKGNSVLTNTWMEYVVPLSLFQLTEDSLGSAKIYCDRISGITIGLSYEYTGDPQYASGSAVYVDSICFGAADKLSIREVDVPGKVYMSKENTKIAVINTFDTGDESVVWALRQGNFSSSDIWSGSKASLSTETASGEGGSLKLDYKSKMVAPFYADVVVDKGVSANGITFLMKGDGKKANVEVVLYTSSKSYVAKISEIADGWNTYSIGFSNFLDNSDKTTAFSDLKNVTGIAINVRNSNGNYVASSLYLDEIYFDNSIKLTAKTTTSYAA